MMRCLLIILLLLIPLQGFAEIVFEENFDSTTTWNAADEHAGSECSVGACTGTFPTGGEDWNFYRSIRADSSLSAPASIRQLPDSQNDHTLGTTSGKAFVGWDQAVDGVNFPGDGILGAYFGSSANYKELYIQFYIKPQSGFLMSSSAQAKLFRTGHWREVSNIFQWANESTPLMFFDWVNSVWGTYIPAYRCEQLPYNSSDRSADYYCSASDQNIPSWMKNDIVAEIESGTFSEVYVDGNWHKIELHLKMNTVGLANGIAALSFDGTEVYNHTDAVWLEDNSSTSTGINFIAIGGNSNNESSSLGEWWYAIDDVCVGESAADMANCGSGTTPSIGSPLGGNSHFNNIGTGLSTAHLRTE